MPAKSKSQQQAAGVALAAKKGEKKVGDLKGPSKSMYQSMSKKELHDMASTPTKDKPDKVAEVKPDRPIDISSGEDVAVDKDVDKDA